MGNKNIVFNCTLEQYNKKYRNRRYRLLKYTKKQVEDFDKQFGHYSYNGKTHSLEFNKYLLKDRKWALIGDTYFEIPKPIRYTWFRNLNAGVQAACCLVGAGVVVSAAVVPATLLNKEKIAFVDESLSNKIKITKIEKGVNANTVIHLEIISGETVEYDVFKGDQLLEEDLDYFIDGEPKKEQIILKKETMEKYQGKILIKSTSKPVEKIIRLKFNYELDKGKDTYKTQSVILQASTNYKLTVNLDSSKAAIKNNHILSKTGGYADLYQNYTDTNSFIIKHDNKILNHKFAGPGQSQSYELYLNSENSEYTSYNTGRISIQFKTISNVNKTEIFFQLLQ